MKIVFAIVALLLSASSLHAQPLDPLDIEKQLTPQTKALLARFAPAAFKGDYQAMRNIAFTWSTDATRERPDALVVGCAWYAQILQRHKAKVHEGDVSNRDLYCGRLTPANIQLALGLSTRIGMRIDDQRPVAAR